VFNKSIFKSYSGYINLFSRVADPMAIVIAGILAFGSRFSSYDSSLPQDYRFIVLVAAFCVVLVFPSFNLYASWRGQGLVKQARAIVLAWVTVVLLMIVILFTFKISSDYSRLWLGLWMIYGLSLLLLYRMCVYTVLHYQRLRGRNYRRVIIVGIGGLGEKLVNQVSESPWSGFKIDALFDDNKELHNTFIKSYPVLGGIDDVEEYLESKNIDEVWISLPFRAERRVKELLYSLRHLTVNIKLVPNIFGFTLLNHSMTELVGLPAVNLSDTPMWGNNQLVKDIEDKVLGLIIFILTSPLLLLISIFIKMTSTGPVLFKQKRHGWDGRVINVYKFRTMKVHSEGDGVVTQAVKGDLRITRLGAFLRCTSLDELPQFFNVLQGRMSIVGPRPHAIQHNEIYKEKVNQYMLRHMVKPGITGWAQVNGLRGETDTLEKMKRRVEFDLYYIENWSFWFDLKIIFLTIFKGFVNKNAH